jgi:hypothetical protein
METEREGRGCDVAQMIFVGLEEMWFFFKPLVSHHIDFGSSD